MILDHQQRQKKTLCGDYTFKNAARTPNFHGSLVTICECLTLWEPQGLTLYVRFTFRPTLQGRDCHPHFIDEKIRDQLSGLLKITSSKRHLLNWTWELTGMDTDMLDGCVTLGNFLGLSKGHFSPSKTGGL